VKIRLLLCPVDFSEFSARAYRYALSLAEHYRAKLVVQHVVEPWRYPSAGFAASAALYDEFCQAVCENGGSNCGNLLRITPTMAFSQSSWCTRISPRMLFCRLRRRRKRMGSSWGRTASEGLTG